MNQPSLHPFSWKQRAAVRCFALVIISIIVLDTLPHSWSWLTRPKQILTSVLNPVGLWQGEWPMFAPDPVINNGWFTAEIRATDGTVTRWDSPYWFEANGWNKFVGFRHIDYFNRLTISGNIVAAEDFADYLARKSPKPVASVKLFKNKLQLKMPEDGSLPRRDEIEWMLSSEFVTLRNYQP